MKILLTHDNSQASRHAIDFAAQLPLRRPIDVDTVEVVSPPLLIDSPNAELPLEIGEFLEGEIQNAHQELDEACRTLEGRDHVHSAHPHVLVGPPTAKLLEFAESSQADLVVLGAIGHSAIKRILLGSVSDYVATHSNTSTLVVRPSGAAEPQLDRVMLALSGRPEDARMLHWVRELKLRPNVEIHLVRVLDLFTFYRQDFRQTSSKAWERQSVEAQSQILDFETELQKLGLNTETHLVQADHVGDALVNYIDRHGIDLAMTGDSDSGLLTRVFLGSVSRHVLRHASCSVLIARDRRDGMHADSRMAGQQSSALPQPHSAGVT